MRCLQPLAALYGALASFNRSRQQAAALKTPWPGRPPIIVVGNFIVGGAGKTPTVIALVEWLRGEGWHPGVVSRGYGRDEGQALLAIEPDTTAQQAGDEPLLIQRRTGVPVVVCRDRRAAAQALCARHTEVDVLLSDDGLQHHRLPRDLEVAVFDNRGAGNGLLLPAGPLRQPLPAQVPPEMLVVYNAQAATTDLPGHLAERRLAGACPLTEWWQGQQRAALQPLSALADRRWLAAAGMGDPERFFTMLERAGLQITRLPLPDHASFSPLPWPAHATDVLVTEKDAVKLRPGQVGGARVWVVALDFALPPSFTDALRASLPSPAVHATAT